MRFWHVQDRFSLTVEETETVPEESLDEEDDT